MSAVHPRPHISVAPHARGPPPPPKEPKVNHRGPRDSDSSDSEVDEDKLEFGVTYLTEIDHVDKGLKLTVWLLCALGMVADRGCTFWLRVVTHTIFMMVTATLTIVSIVAAWDATLYLRIVFIVMACIGGTACLASAMVWRAMHTIKIYTNFVYSGRFAHHSARPWTLCRSKIRLSSGWLISIVFILPIIGILVTIGVLVGVKGTADAFRGLDVQVFIDQIGGTIWFTFCMIALVWSLLVLWLCLRLYCILCDSATVQYMQIAREIEANLSNLAPLHSFFERHSRLSLVVDRLSDKMEIFIAGMFVATVVALMTAEYSFISDINSALTTEIVVAILLMVMLVFEYTILCLPAAYLHLKAHAPLSSLHYMMIATDVLTNSAQSDKYRVADAFNNRLTTTKIGINVGWSVISIAFTVTSFFLVITTPLTVMEWFGAISTA